MQSLARAFFVVALPIWLAACDPVYPLFVRNGLSKPVVIQIIYEGGVSNEGILQPGERLSFIHTLGGIKGVVVLSGNQVLYRLNEQALLDMYRSVPDMRQVTWNIQSDGIKALGDSELDQLQ